MNSLNLQLKYIEINVTMITMLVTTIMIMFENALHGLINFNRVLLFENKDARIMNKKGMNRINTVDTKKIQVFMRNLCQYSIVEKFPFFFLIASRDSFWSEYSHDNSSSSAERTYKP